MKTLIVLVITLALLTSTAYAACRYDGSLYPTGTVIGSRICGADGYWKRR